MLKMKLKQHHCSRTHQKLRRLEQNWLILCGNEKSCQHFLVFLHDLDLMKVRARSLMSYLERLML